jgi:hypothetical protein
MLLSTLHLFTSHLDLGSLITASVASIALTRWYARGSQAIRAYIARAARLFRQVEDGMPVTTSQVRSEDWLATNANFEVSLGLIRDRPLRRWCRRVVQLVREICGVALPRVRARWMTSLKEASQLMVAREGTQICERVLHRLSWLNFLTYGR